MADLLVLWLWYLLAFALGVAATWFAVTRLVRPRTADEAVERALTREGDTTR